ncbi:MAG: HAD superfamily hydrolase (TIGR01490 family) [Gammaproteobacteria bacterium]|jgi:HAD superfamily hydrolase (TIGR01490 family)
MALAIFDLDHTLLNGDSDYLWGEYMVANNIVDAATYERENKAYLDDYLRGDLDNEVYLQFALKPLTQYPIDRLYAWRKDYVENWIQPIIARGAYALLEKHRAQDDDLIIISATNLFITAPIAELLGISDILSTEPEIIDNQYTGRYLGTPTFKEGKVTVLNDWLKNSRHTLDNSYFYSDSINDLPLLEQVATPIAVNPDQKLSTIAADRNWQILDLRV